MALQLTNGNALQKMIMRSYNNYKTYKSCTGTGRNFYTCINRKLMKKILIVVVLGCMWSACDTHVKISETTIDSAGNKLQKTVEKGADSTAAKLKRLGEKIDAKMDSLEEQ